ncbi:MAG: prephenate dehydratase [Polyangiaceae bacterium]|nr:prephenate dehydratase [Polyangiaceae bacterium]
MSATEAPTVSYLGPEGTFSHSAALQAFGDSASLVQVPTIAGVFHAVANGETLLGVAPIENSIDGGVGVALDGLLEHGLQIQSEIVLRVSQCLLAQHGELSRIERVYSHPQGLGQCRGWLHAHLPHAELLVSQSTGAAAAEAARDEATAAVASELSAGLHRLKVVARNIQDIGENITRFVVLGKQPVPRTGNDKTSLAFSTPHERGALFRVLQVFDEESLNLTRIESRPSKEKLWEYVFFVDVEGHREDLPVRNAIERLEKSCSLFRILGSYPRAVEGQLPGN